MSLLFHGILISAVYAVSSSHVKNDPPPIIIDFTISADKGPDSVPSDKAAGPATPKGKPAGRQRSAPEKSHPATRSKPQRAEPMVADKALKTAVEQSGPSATFAQPKVETAALVKNEATGTSDSPIRTGGSSGLGKSGSATVGSGTSGTSSGGGGGGVSATSSGSGGISAEQLRNKYLKEHFAYIKDLIQRNITYPARARKMGWSGKVVVSFIIHESGRVSNEKVVTTSGFDLLDSNVISAIRAVAPFPRPPVKAELRVPIIYHLE